jgi:hypothetical protein
VGRRGFVSGLSRNVASGRSARAQRPESIAQLLGEDRRLLELGEVAATVELVPVDERGTGAVMTATLG